MQSFLLAVAERAVDAGLAPPQVSAGLESLDANCLLIISLKYVIIRPEGSCDSRNAMLGRLAQVSRQLQTLLRPLLAHDWRRHRQRKNSLTRLAQRLGVQGSWNHQLKRVRLTAQATARPRECSCGRTFPMSQMYQLLDDLGIDEGASQLVCVACARNRYRLGSSRGPLRGRLFETRVELTDDYGEGGEAAAMLRFALCSSGYGLDLRCVHEQLRPGATSRVEHPLCDADGAVLCDLLVSGLGRRCLWIDVGGSALGDTGLTAFARALPACTSLMHLNLNGTRVGDQGVESLAAVLAPNPRSRDVACKELKWLYLVLDALCDAGAIALAAALGKGAAPQLECLWCCGAFSAASEPGEAGPGFTALTRACEAREDSGLVLELEHGFAWGM